LVEGEPGDLEGFVGLAVAGLAGCGAAKVGGRDPVLVFVRDQMVGNAEEALDGDGEADFFEGFAESALGERLEVFEFSAADAPAAGFGRILAKGEENAILVVENENADADAGSGFLLC
jgi:hypothetical protein